MTEVVAALIWDQDKFMICQRPAHKARGLLWEFVGGKVEPGETKEQALIRECREELAITLNVGKVFMDVTHEYPDLTVHLTLFHAAIREGFLVDRRGRDLRKVEQRTTADTRRHGKRRGKGDEGLLGTPAPRGLLHGDVLPRSGRGRLGLLRGRGLVGCYGCAAGGAKEGVVDKRRATRATKHGGLLSVHSFHHEGKPKNAALVAQHSAQTTAKGRSSQVPLCWFEHLFYTYTCSIVGMLAPDLKCN